MAAPRSAVRQGVGLVQYDVGEKNGASGAKEAAPGPADARYRASAAYIPVSTVSGSVVAPVGGVVMPPSMISREGPAGGNRTSSTAATRRLVGYSALTKAFTAVAAARSTRSTPVL